MKFLQIASIIAVASAHKLNSQSSDHAAAFTTEQAKAMSEFMAEMESAEAQME